MAEQLRGPFEKFVHWRQYAAVMQREAYVNGPRTLLLHIQKSTSSSLEWEAVCSDRDTLYFTWTFQENRKDCSLPHAYEFNIRNICIISWKALRIFSL
jgi:hypothetical protein